MMAKNSRYYSLLLLITDILLLTLAFSLAYFIRVKLDNRPLFSEVYAFDYFLAFITVLPFWILIFASLGLYSPANYNRRLAEWSKIILGCFIGILLIIGWEYVSRKAFFPARLATVYAFVGSVGMLILGRELLRLGRGLAYLYGIGVSKVLLVGTSKTVADISESLSDTKRSGFQIAAIACPKAFFPSDSSAMHFSKIELALKNLEDLGITTIIQTDLYDSEERNSRILTAAQSRHLNYSFIPGEAGFYTGKNTVDVFLGYPMITVSETPLVGWGAIFKRVFDTLLVVLTSIIWLPLLLILSLLQLLFNRGPILFHSERLGRYGEKICVYKFRSMKPEYSGQDAIKIFKSMGREDLAKEYAINRKVDDDPRITRFGKFLRETSLDEIPQLLNVLKGEMSLVGPRPILPDERGFYKDHRSLLFSVKPGITGLWQVSGRSNMSFDERATLELYYAQNWSFWMDIKILLKTILVVVRRKGAK